MKIATRAEGVTRREKSGQTPAGPGCSVLSTGEITIQRINIRETDYVINWIEIYPLDSVIHRSTNWGQFGLVFSSSFELFPPCITFHEGGDFHARSRNALVLLI